MKSVLPFPLTVIGCSVLQAELQLLATAHWPEARLRMLDSGLHLSPQCLASSMEQAVNEELAEGRRVVLVYGECHAFMDRLEGREGLVRVNGRNCMHLLLGDCDYGELLRQRVFFLLPEWLGRWRSIFRQGLGLNEENARGLMGETHSKLLYLDSGLQALPEADLEACATYCGLPWERREVDLHHLHIKIQEALDSLCAYR